MNLNIFCRNHRFEFLSEIFPKILTFERIRTLKNLQIKKKKHENWVSIIFWIKNESNLTILWKLVSGFKSSSIGNETFAYWPKTYCKPSSLPWPQRAEFYTGKKISLPLFQQFLGCNFGDSNYRRRLDAYQSWSGVFPNPPND